MEFGEKGHNNKFYVCLYEGAGTMMLLFAINMSEGNPVAIGLTIAIAIFLYDHITASHYNGAVTTAVLIREKKLSNLPFYFMILASQVLGGFIGVFFVWLCNQANCGIETPGAKTVDCRYATLAPANGILDASTAMYGQVFVTELWGTYFLCSVIMTVKYQIKDAPLVLNAFIIGLTLTMLVICGGPTSGASFNPAVSIVQCIFQVLVQPTVQDPTMKYTLRYLPVYLAANISGGLLSGFLTMHSTKAQFAVQGQTKAEANLEAKTVFVAGQP